MKSNQNIDKDYQQEIKFTELPYNAPQTQVVENSPLYIKYKKWLKDNGVLVDPRVRYPTYFGDTDKGVVGISASKGIQRKRAIISVPYDLLITVDKVKQVEQLSIIIKQNLTFFKSTDDAALKILILYMSFELLKGQKSFYHPYFAISQEEHLNGWSNWTQYMLEHRGLIGSVKQQKEQIQKQFMNYLRIFRRYQKVFPQNLSNNEYKALFERSYSFIITRAFGWSLPSISLIPLADSMNHGNIRYVDHFLINIDQEKHPSEGKNYQKYAKKVNLSILKDQFFNLTNEELAELRKEKKKKVVKFVQKHKQLLIQSQKLLAGSQKSIDQKIGNDNRQKQFHILHQQYKAGIHKLKNLHFYQSSCSEDNDTDEDQLFDRELLQENFQLDDRGRTIKEASKKKEVKKLWDLYYDNEQAQQDEEEDQEEVVPQKIQNKKQQKSEVQQKLYKQNDSSEVSSQEEEEEDQVFDWVDAADSKKTYFVMTTREVIRQNQQIYNFYGRRSNKYLLLGYNFVLKDNIYDSFDLKLKLDPKLTTKVAVSKLLEVGVKKNQSHKSRNIKLKKFRINKDLISICRSYVILWTKKQWNNCRLLTPFDREIEAKTLQLYQDIIRCVLKEYSTSVEEDEQLQENNNLKYEERVAIMLRKQYKQILIAQDLLVGKCQYFLKKWNPKAAVQELQQSDFKWIKRVKSYVLSLENAESL